MKKIIPFLIACLPFISCTNSAKKDSKEVSTTTEKQVATEAEYPKPEQKPNIIFIMADDLGYADLGYHGSNIPTPNIDKLAKEGVQLEQNYGMPVCTPSRAALMTGRYPMRYGMQTLVIFPNHKWGLDTAERTMAQAMKEAGYYTALIGKWHLGHADAKYWPQNRGFDYFYGNASGEVDYFTHERSGVLDWQRNGEYLNEKGYYTDLQGNEAVKLITNYDKVKPLFLYLPFLATHAPYQAPEEMIQKYMTLAGNDKTKATYIAMLTMMDTEIGRVLDALAKNDMSKNTLIVFSSDNGGVANALFATGAHAPGDESTEDYSKVTLPASNGILKGGKGSLYEGGIRVPGIAYWPGVLKPAVVNEPVIMEDWFPTFVNLAKGTLKQDKPLDGIDAWGVIAGGQKTRHEDFLCNVEVFRGAIRKGDWKLIRLATLPGKTELYNLAKDPGEKENVAEQNPEIVSDLEKRLIAYSKEQKMALWLTAQKDYLGFQSPMAIDDDYSIGEGGTPEMKMILPASSKKK